MEWINVKDRLPELIDKGPKYNPCSERVLVYDGNKISVGVRWKCGKNEYFSSHEEEFYEVITHWMPLPEPPIEEVKLKGNIAEQKAMPELNDDLIIKKLPDWGDDSLSFAYWDRMHKEKGCQDDN